jgi:hypothetical protein
MPDGGVSPTVCGWPASTRVFRWLVQGVDLDMWVLGAPGSG